MEDLLIHLSAHQLQKKANEVIAGEDLNVLVGNIPLEGKEKEAVKENILVLLKDKYDFVLITTHGDILHEMNKRNISYI